MKVTFIFAKSRKNKTRQTHKPASSSLAVERVEIRVKEMRRVWANKRMSVSFLGIGIDFPEIQALPSFVLLPFLP